MLPPLRVQTRKVPRFGGAHSQMSRAPVGVRHRFSSQLKILCLLHMRCRTLFCEE